jgi:endonuclease YncB( thermonuclease family)
MGQVALISRFALLALVLASSAHAETDSDTIVRSTAKPRFQVVDGDTVKFGPQLVRMFGIDAPERGQTCDDGQWHPGPLAKKALEAFINSRLSPASRLTTTLAITVRWRSALPATMTYRR